jgi:biopolymer transport protein ExbB/TolQ
MNDDFTKTMQQQAKEMQERFAAAMADTEKFRDAFLKQARETADTTHEQTKAAIDQIESAMKAGSEFFAKFVKGETD